MSKRPSTPTDIAFSSPAKRAKTSISKIDALADVAGKVLKPSPKRVMDLKHEETVERMFTQNPDLRQCFAMTKEMKSEFNACANKISTGSGDMLRHAIIERAKMVSGAVFNMKNDSVARTAVYVNQVNRARYALGNRYRDHVVKIATLSELPLIEKNLEEQLRCIREDSLLLKSHVENTNAELLIRQRIYQQLITEFKAVKGIQRLK